jgi:tRNA pseudouridine55 synthase
MKNKEVFSLYKPVGVSPLDVIKKFKEKNPDFKNKKIAYAGRLDPMAEGVVVVILGSNLKKFKEFLKLDKEYEAEIIFGISSDSFDILGFPERKKFSCSEKEVADVFRKIKKDFYFYPPIFSSYRFKGKPLFWWARQGREEEVELPLKRATIYSLKILDKMILEKKDLELAVFEKLKKVCGDFRQEKIADSWKDFFEKEQESYLVFKVKIKCSSGCYIRSIADIVGKELNSGAVLFSLKRTKVGDFNIENSLNYFN